jgi:hypothetical protein
MVLFTLIDSIDSSLAVSPELYLFYSDDFLADNWISHPMNPVVSDVRYARRLERLLSGTGKYTDLLRIAPGDMGIHLISMRSLL